MYRLPNPLSLTAEQRREYRGADAGSRFAGGTPIELDDGTGLYITDDGSRFYLVAFMGKALRRDRRVSGYYRSAEQRELAIERIKASRAAGQVEVARRRAERRRPHTLAVGDVLNTCWGYEQTNVEFYEVVAVRGAVVDLRELAKDRTEDGPMQGTCTPCPGRYLGEVIKGKRPNARNRVRIESFSSASPWNGRPVSWSSYA